MWQARFSTIDSEGAEVRDDTYTTTRQEAREYVAMRRQDGWRIWNVRIVNQTIDHFAGEQA